MIEYSGMMSSTQQHCIKGHSIERRRSIGPSTGRFTEKPVRLALICCQSN